MTWLNLDSLESQLKTERIGRRVVYLTSTGSTMDIARREAEDGAEDGTVVIAEEQTKGRGRFGRAWESPAGKNLYFTVVLRPPVDRLRLLSMAAPLAVAKGVEGVTGHVPRIKWPNDVLMSGRKLAGVLIESEIAGDEVRYALARHRDQRELRRVVEPRDRRPSRRASRPRRGRRSLERRSSRPSSTASKCSTTASRQSSTPVGAASSTRWAPRSPSRSETRRFEGVAEDVDIEGNLLLRRAGRRAADVRGRRSNATRLKLPCRVRWCR